LPREADVPYFNFRHGGSEEWRAGAACGAIGTKHPWTATGPGSKPALRLGKEICNGICPVQPQCLAYALRAEIHHGTWGGMTESERNRLREAQRHHIITTGRMTRYDVEQLVTIKEYRMVVVIAKTKFVPHLSPGEVGEVEDPLARAAVRNGYAELVGEVQNFDDWMYHGADLIVAGRTATANAESRKAGGKKPQKDMVASTVSMEETA
jgi:WhiB family redox-sensing transcriptional regulator